MTRSHVPILHLKKEPKPRSRLTRGGRIKPVSAKMAKISKIYRALKLQFLQEHPLCQHWLHENGFDESRAVKLHNEFSGSYVTAGTNMADLKTIRTWDIPKSTQVHHRRGRGKYHLDVSTWMAVSAEGHAAIHADPEKSYRLGYMLPR
jgi:hypothetical protein